MVKLRRSRNLKLCDLTRSHPAVTAKANGKATAISVGKSLTMRAKYACTFSSQGEKAITIKVASKTTRRIRNQRHRTSLMWFSFTSHFAIMGQQTGDSAPDSGPGLHGKSGSPLFGVGSCLRTWEAPWKMAHLMGKPLAFPQVLVKPGEGRF